MTYDGFARLILYILRTQYFIIDAIGKKLPEMQGSKMQLIILIRGRPFAKAANSYVEFPACMSQKFGHWANIRPLLEKAKKLTICIGNSAPLRTFFRKNLEKFDYRFLRKQKLFIGPF